MPEVPPDKQAELSALGDNIAANTRVILELATDSTGDLKVATRLSVVTVVAWVLAAPILTAVAPAAAWAPIAALFLQLVPPLVLFWLLGVARVASETQLLHEAFVEHMQRLSRFEKTLPHREAWDELIGLRDETVSFSNKTVRRLRELERKRVLELVTYAVSLKKRVDPPNGAEPNNQKRLPEGKE